jgi:sulfoxide reductase heme-binding subunit YedZ
MSHVDADSSALAAPASAAAEIHDSGARVAGDGVLRPKASARTPFQRWFPRAVFIACLLPLAKLGLDGATDGLSANPIAEVMNRLGFWTLTLLVSSLTATPLKTLFGLVAPLRVRKMVGLFAFFYGALHLVTYAALDQGFDLDDIGADIVKRKFITVGFAAFMTLVPLALTSTDRAVKRLGFRRWKRLHRLVYLAAVLGVVHFVWRVKADYAPPAIFAVALAALLASRLVPARAKSWTRPRLPSRGD